MDIFQFDSYRSYLKERAKEKRGTSRKLSLFIGIHTSLLSQVLSGARDLSPEQLLKATEFFGLTERETEYLLLLLQLERAGTEKLKLFYRKRVSGVQKEASQIRSRVPAGKKLTEADQAIFYSQWYLSAIRLMTSLPAYDTVEKISDTLGIDLLQVRSSLDFLVRAGLCARSREGRYELKALRTHVEKESALSKRHHVNWRLKAIEEIQNQGDSDLFFTAPLTISSKDAEAFRYELVQLIERLGKRVEKSDSENLYCLNIDWFSLVK